MSLKIRRSDWFIGDLEHYAAWYQREASFEVAEQYLHAVSTTLARRDSQPRLCGTFAFIGSSDHSRST